MIKLYSSLFIGLFAAQLGWGQTAQKIIDSKIERATVFLKGAQVTRVGKTPVPAGRSELVFKGVSPDLDAQSIQLKAEGRFTVLSVVHQMNYLQKQNDRQEIARLEARKQPLRDRREQEVDLLGVFAKEEELLGKNQEVKGDNNNLKALELKEMADFHRARWLEIKAKQLEIARSVRRIDSSLQKIEAQMKALNNPRDVSTSEVIVTVSAKEATTGDFVLAYFVQNAGWFPTYDLRVENIAKPIELTYKANVQQSTGEDWKEIRLTLSNGDPNQSGVKPELRPWYLGYNQTTGLGGTVTYGNPSASFTKVTGKVLDSEGNTPLPGANITIKGTSVGTVTNAGGNYSLALPTGARELVFSHVGFVTQTIPIRYYPMINVSLAQEVRTVSEVVVNGYGTSGDGGNTRSDRDYQRERKLKTTVPIEVAEVEGQTSISFDITTPYTIPTDGKNYAVEIKEIELPATYQHYCVPKLDLGVFMAAQVTGWEAYNLMEGEANLFFEGTYLGKTVLDTRNLDDTLNISLGRDKSVIVSRTKLKNFGKRQFIASERSEERGWEISLRNTKRQRVNLILEDQFPVSTNKAITVERLEAKEAEVEDATGKLTWKLQLEPAREKKIGFKYVVKYPKSGTIEVD